MPTEVILEILNDPILKNRPELREWSVECRTEVKAKKLARKYRNTWNQMVKLNTDFLTEEEVTQLLLRAGVDLSEPDYVDTGNLLEVIIKLQTRIDSDRKADT